MPEDRGWRTSLALASIPAFVLTMGGLFLPETPNSLLERGHDAQARKILVKIRGTEDVDAEYEDIRIAATESTGVRACLTADACAFGSMQPYLRMISVASVTTFSKCTAGLCLKACPHWGCI